MKNKERIEREIREAASKIDSGEMSSEVLARTAIRCVELEGENARGKININQQVGRLVEEILDRRETTN